MDLFWPSHWEIIVVLDAESAADRKLALELPDWVRVEFEEPPPLFDLYIPLLKQTSSGERFTTGYTRGQYSAFWADLYTTAEYVAVADSDIAFVTPAVQLALFREGLPLNFGECSNKSERNQYSLIFEELGIDQFALFMYTLPFIMRRSDFAALRSFISERMQNSDLKDIHVDWPETPAYAKKAAEERGAGVYFPEAFVDLQNSVARRASVIYGANTFGRASGQLLLSFEAIAGSFLWNFRRTSYAWSLRNCRRAPSVTLCAGLCAAIHYAMTAYGVPKSHQLVLRLGNEAIMRARCAFGEGSIARDTASENKSACTERNRELWVFDLLQCSGTSDRMAKTLPTKHAQLLWPRRKSACASYGAATLLAEQRRFLWNHRRLPRQRL